MASATSLSPVSQPEHRSLSHWMEKVLKELAHVRTAPDADAVHDLRVAIRRCRALAAVMEEVDPHPAWKKMRKQARKLFHELGALRDTQVMKEWVEKLGPEGDALRAQMLAALQVNEQSAYADALEAANGFDEEAWKGLEKTLRARARLVPQGGLAAECLALERYEDAKELHARAMRTEKSKPWHELRIGVKRFRYTVEGLLPAHHEAWIGNMKRMQDLLGEVHDLDVLAAMVGEADVEKPLGDHWQERIAGERQARVEKYRQITAGNNSAWAEWRHGLPHGNKLRDASMARLKATAKAATRHRQKAAQVSRMSVAIFRGLARLKATEEISDPRVNRVMRAAAGLHAVRNGKSNKAANKAAQDFLQHLRVPPGWPTEEWEEVTAAVRYQRGKEPEEKKGAYARLSEEQRRVVCATAGVLRLARALVKCGATRSSGMRMEKTEESIVLKLAGLADTEESAARLGAAKHLLQRCIGKPLLLVAQPVPQPKAATQPAETQPVLAFTAMASD